MGISVLVLLLLLLLQQVLLILRVVDWALDWELSFVYSVLFVKFELDIGLVHHRALVHEVGQDWGLWLHAVVSLHSPYLAVLLVDLPDSRDHIHSIRLPGTFSLIGLAR